MQNELFPVIHTPRCKDNTSNYAKFSRNIEYAIICHIFYKNTRLYLPKPSKIKYLRKLLFLCFINTFQIYTLYE
jgi:hypothetical protein